MYYYYGVSILTLLINKDFYFSPDSITNIMRAVPVTITPVPLNFR